MPGLSTSDLINTGYSEWCAPNYENIVKRDASIAQATLDGYNYLGEGNLSLDVLFSSDGGAKWAIEAHESGGLDEYARAQKRTTGREWTVENRTRTITMSGKTSEGAILQYKVDRARMGDKETRIKLEAGPESTSGSTLGPRVIYIGNLHDSTATQADAIDPTSENPPTVTFKFKCDMYERPEPGAFMSPERQAFFQETLKDFFAAD